MADKRRDRRVIEKKSGKILSVVKIVGERHGDSDTDKYKRGTIVVANPEYVPNPMAHIPYLYLHPDDVETYVEKQTTLSYFESVRRKQDDNSKFIDEV